MANRLADETSPYLLQHADNPVDWHPWDDRALNKAREENKPILLSIGYSACHWCHVMAHESFEDPETAELMNRLFVNIKVDREERPDLDKIYQLAHSALTRRGGGWPLTVFLTPDRVPFFGGTYFPKTPRYGMPAFKEILEKVSDYLNAHPGDIERQNASLLEFLSTLERADHGAAAGTDAVIREAVDGLETHFDAINGGFGEPPKFPQVSTLDLALRLGVESARPRLKHMAVFSLRKMADGGIRDHLGGGFFRYSVDESWTIPHFEKMLYDNALLLDCYSRAWRVTGEPAFRDAATGIAEWLLGDMRDPEGGFYAALDADSEGEEGRYYLWTPEEVKAVIDEPDYSLFAATFGLDRPPNFEHRWHLRICRNPADAGAELDINSGSAGEQLRRACAALLQHRRQRSAPQRDYKILTAWNALAIKGLTVAGLHLDEPAWIDAAGRALDHLKKTLWNGERLLAACTAGQARYNAYLDDYAFLLDAIMHLLQARWDTRQLAFARSLAGVLLRQFRDSERGGFFFTSADHESLIHRPKTLADESTPAGGMVAARALAALGHLTGDTACLDAAAPALEAAKGAALQVPLAHGTALAGLLEHNSPPLQIVLRGDETVMQRWAEQARALCTPWAAVYAVGADEADLPDALAEKPARSECTAYICEGAQCSAPIRTADELADALENK